jgi:uncharacterized protein YgbK (DUF1537 family)
MTMAQQTNVRPESAVAVPAGIVADDLTGATDSVVQFARAGWKARLALTTPTAGSADVGAVVAVVTDARAHAPGTASADTASAVAELLTSGIHRLFLKIDSTLRGSVLHQVTGAIEAWSTEHPDAMAVVCSAYPAMGRTIVDGEMLVHGAGVHTTAIGRDPVTPVTTSAVRELLPGAVALRLTGTTPVEDAAQIEAAASTAPQRVVSVDAVTDDDLSRLAEAVNLIGPRAIPVGAAGLAVAMSRIWAPAATVAAPATVPTVPGAVDRVAVVGSSLHEVSRVQVQALLDALPANQVLTLGPTLDQALEPTGMAAWAANELARVSVLPAVVVITSPPERSAAPLGEPGEPASERIARSLAIISDVVFSSSSIGAFVLLGGEGARAVLDGLGAESLLVHDTVREGIPIATLEGGKADGVLVVTKAGGFGTPTALAEIVPELLHSTLFNTEGNLS